MGSCGSWFRPGLLLRQRDVGLADHVAPFFGLGLNMGAERLGCAERQGHALPRELFRAHRAPRYVKFACWFSQAIASFGVPAGTNSANQDDTTTLGDAGLRHRRHLGDLRRALLGGDKPSARTLPAWMLFIALPRLSNTIGMWPAITSWLAGAAPR